MTYVIICTTHTYGAGTDRKYLLTEDNGRASIYSTRGDAHAGICALNNRGRIYLDHNESGPPSYRVAPAHSLPQYLRWYL